MRRQPTRLFAALIAAALFQLAAAGVSSVSAAPKGANWGPDYFPNSIVTTHEGKKVHFYDDLIKDKIVIINFIYTSCADTCPLQTARLAEVQRMLGDDIGTRYQMYSISLDPERDTPEKLAEHAKAYDAGPGWTFITGDPSELAVIRHKLGERSRSLNEHRTDMVVGNDIKGSWRRTSAFDDFERIVLAIREMDHDWLSGKLKDERFTTQYSENTRRITLSAAQQTGQAMFQKGCAACHTIGAGKKVGPDLYDVTARRERQWLVNFIMHPDVMRDRKDPIAVALHAQYPGTKMPYLGISETDAGDLLAYIDTWTKYIKASQGDRVEKLQEKGG